jgi:hypothetical protein
MHSSATIHPYYNVQSYALGNEWNSNLWFLFRCFDQLSFSLRAEAIERGSIRGFDASIASLQEPATDVHNYGGRFINSFLGAAYRFHKHSIAAEFGIPSYQKCIGIQTVSNSTFYLTYYLTL